MRVIGSGFGRTGTRSMKAALEELGYGPCYHMDDVLRRPAHVAVWHDAAAGRAVDWDQLFAGYDAAVDFPASVVYRELLDVFPDARVVHTVRPADEWYRSTAATIYRGRTLVPRWLLRFVPPLRRWHEMVDAFVWDGLFSGRFEDREHAIEVSERWTAEVVATVPADRLLVFDVAEGWAPLCDFLEVLQPGAPFPRVNDRASMVRRLRVVRVASRLLPFVGMGVAAGLYALARRVRRR